MYKTWSSILLRCQVGNAYCLHNHNNKNLPGWYKIMSGMESRFKMLHQRSKDKSGSFYFPYYHLYYIKFVSQSLGNLIWKVLPYKCSKGSCFSLVKAWRSCNLIKWTIKLVGRTFGCVVYPTKTYNAFLIVCNKSRTHLCKYKYSFIQKTDSQKGHTYVHSLDRQSRLFWKPRCLFKISVI